MSVLEWLLSLCTLIWLLVCALFDFRERRVPNLWWTALPAVLAIAFRAAVGPVEPALAAAMAIAVSERRQMHGWWPAAIALLAALIALALLASASMEGASGFALLPVLAVLFFWISWENRWLGGADALALIVSVLLWPTLAWLLAYLVAGGVWSLAARIRSGGWMQWHAVPGLGVVATAALMYLGYQAVLNLA